jgi:hypothetical protein
MPDPVGGTRATVLKERHVIHKTKKPRWTATKMFCSSWRSQKYRPCRRLRPVTLPH